MKNIFFSRLVRFVFLFILLQLLFSCLSFQVPKEYVPDDKVVYLKQKVEFSPIEYEIKKTEPYKWEYEIEVDKVNPSFIKINDFNQFLKPDFASDVKLFNEIKKHLLFMKDNEIFNKLKTSLNNYKFVIPEKRKITLGDKVKDYTNAVEYNYPEVSNSTITAFNNGDYKIKLNNGNEYYYKQEGYYFENDSQGNEVYAVFPAQNSFRILDNGIKYSKNSDNNIAIETKEGEVSKFSNPVPQYKFKIINGKLEYIFFIDNKENITQIALIINNFLRYDYVMKEDYILIVKNEESIQIDNKYEKKHSSFNTKTLKSEKILSVYFPEGININLKNELTSSKVKPAWPENYISKKIGNFIIYYVKKDESYISKIDSKKLNDIFDFVKKTSGLQSEVDRAIILPPDLESYRKIHANDKEETLNWYPSGFQTKDIIIMWPPSVKRYNMPEGEAYFWDTEFYDIFVHELTHLMVGEVGGVFSHIPVWLNEGLALHVESEWSQETKKYWDVTFLGSYNLNKLLTWDDVTTYSTSYFPVDKARVHYAQSYKMASFLINQYGKEKVLNYLKSFRIVVDENHDKYDLKSKYIENFEKLFGVSWDDNIKMFDKYITQIGTD
ncbi:MAG: hypothetical protein A2086_09735 [Spirochaetes bacterium GWD1_27_9]|nr:MAG: hypothetical protein A2086_09735 [Spirochaetes bacterium GWD1_27_9]